LRNDLTLFNFYQVYNLNIYYAQATTEEISRYKSTYTGSTIPVINVHGPITPEW